MRTLVLLTALSAVSGKVLLVNPDSPSANLKGKVKTAAGTNLDSFWTQPDFETYDNHQGRFFKPAVSSSFSLIKLNNVNVTFLDNTNLRGYDGADVATLGKYQVETRMGMIEHCNSRNFDDVDGILGFGWADQPRSAALLKTLTQPDRPGWNIKGQKFAGDGSPMPRKFAFTADNQMGELHLGGYDPKIIADDFVMMPMTGQNVYGIDIHSISYGGVELLHFDSGKTSFVGEFDSGTTCLLLPNTDVKGNFTRSPFKVLADEQAYGSRHPLVYKARDLEGNEHTFEMAYTECVEPTEETMILGDPWFRRFVVMHDLVDLNNKKMGLAPRAAGYRLGAHTDRSILTPGHEPGQLREVSKVHAVKRHRGAGFVQALHEMRHGLATTTSLSAAPGAFVDKVAVKSQSMVTYNIQLAVGTPPQPLDVIFDTGSFMLAIFAEKPPHGMKPLLADAKKPASKAAPVPAHERKAAVGKMVRTIRSHVSRADARVEELAQVQGLTATAGGGLVSGEGMAVGVTTCSALVLLGLLFTLRRRRGPAAALSDRTYGTC